MRIQKKAVALLVALCGAGVWYAEACHGGLAGGHDPSPFAGGLDLSRPPFTWYCASSWSDDPVVERRGMSIFAWRLFLALNWPGRFVGGGKKWEPATGAASLAELNAGGTYPRWSSWYTTGQLYVELKGHASDVPDRIVDGWACNDACLKTTLEGNVFRDSNKPVYDQNGRAVRYEVRLEKETFLRALTSAGIVGPAHTPAAEVVPGASSVTLPASVPAPAPSVSPPQPGHLVTLNFTGGQCQGEGPSDKKDGQGDSYFLYGAISAKLAWKELTEDERKSGRFLWRRAALPERGEVYLGLVAFHIAQLSDHYPQWIWSTFEHVDNVQPTEHAVAPSFNDPSCKTCCPNESERDPVSGLCRTQVTRAPIPAPVRELNEEVRGWLRANGSVLQHYELVGVQYSPYRAQQEDAGKPDPTVLRNSIIEMYLDGTNHSCQHERQRCGAGSEQGDEVDVPPPSNCMQCHGRAGKGDHDFTFVPSISLCNCADRGKPPGVPRRWLGDRPCAKLVRCE